MKNYKKLYLEIDEDIVKILSTGNDEDVDRLNRYLQIYIELKNKQD